MPAYRNGYVPEHLLVIFKRGRNSIDGDWYWGLSAATYVRHLALVARARARNSKVTLSPTEGFSCYRPYWAQVIAKRVHGIYAAAPGESSHGGFWEGRQTLAIDYHNWGQVYGWDQAAWFADCRAVGLTPGMIMRSRGYPDEPWHVIDLDPWGPVPAFAGVFSPFLPNVVVPPPPKPKEVDMIAVHAKEMLPNWRFVIGPGYIKNTPGEQAQRYAAMTDQQVHDLDDAWLAETMWTHGLGEVFDGTPASLKQFLISLMNGGFYVASWARSTGPSVLNVTADEIAAPGNGSTTDAPLVPR